MKKILVPTDFSETADKARDYAVQIAQIFGSEIILLNTYHVPYAGASAGTLVNIDGMALEDSKKNMAEQLAYVRENFSNITFRTLCSPGLLVDSVKSVVKEENIELVVMGTTGTSGMLENFLGSNTSSLIGSIQVPIITVPARAVINFPKKIVVANDLSDSGENHVYDIVKKIAANNKASLDFLFVANGYDQINNKIEKLKAARFDEEFDSSYHPFHFRTHPDPTEGVLEFLKDKHFDMLVVVCHQRNFWQRLVDKSVSKSLVKHADIPMLVLAAS